MDVSSPQREQLLDRIAGILVCPACRSPLEVPADLNGEARVECPRCRATLEARGGQWRSGGFGEAEVKSDWLNRAKEAAKRRLGSIYPLAIELLSPVLARPRIEPFLRRFDLERDLVVDLGSGTSSYQDRVVCIDGVNYANVHVVADLRSLPFRDGSVAGIVSVAVLEHVPDPRAYVAEMWRVLRPGGRVLCYIPFMQGFHASPYDYQRYTIPGLRQLFADFECEETRIGAGPTSGMLWILQEWLALLFSFGSRRLYRLLMPCLWILSPLKYLDLLLAHHPEAQVIASAFVIEARKPAAVPDPAPPAA